MEPKTITATELARNLSDVLNRVKYRGETYVIERNGERVATLTPPTPKARTAAELIRRIGHWRMPEGLGEDVEQALGSIEGLPEPP
jgi:prevent-host-death family protein